MQTVELVGRLCLALAVVLGAIWLIAKKARGGARAKVRSGKLIDVLGRQPLTRGSSVAVVRVGERALIVGVTDSNVRVLGEMELDEAANHLAADAAPRRSKSAPTAPAHFGETLGHDVILGETDGTPNADDAFAGIDELRARRLTAAQAPAPAPDLIPPAEPLKAAAGGRLSGSALSPATWKQTIDALREMTARKG